MKWWVLNICSSLRSSLPSGQSGQPSLRHEFGMQFEPSEQQNTSSQCFSSDLSLGPQSGMLSQRLLPSMHMPLVSQPHFPEGHAVGAGKPSHTEQQFFHNTCLLVKLLLSHSSAVPNLPIDELYDEVLHKRVAMDEWPMFAYNRFCAAADAEPVREFSKP